MWLVVTTTKLAMEFNKIQIRYVGLRFYGRAATFANVPYSVKSTQRRSAAGDMPEPATTTMTPPYNPQTYCLLNQSRPRDRSNKLFHFSFFSFLILIAGATTICCCTATPALSVYVLLSIKYGCNSIVINSSYKVNFGGIPVTI